MPRKDPITGCNVMSMGEFWLSEAERENKTVDEIIGEFYSEIDKTNKEYESNIMNNPDSVANIVIRSAVSEWQAEMEEREYRNYDEDYNQVEVFYPLAIANIESANVEDNMSGSGLKISGEILCSDGITRKFNYWNHYCHGSFYEPPSGEEYLEWLI